MSVGRNDKCPCGSGLKYKKCCLQKESAVPQVSTSSQGRNQDRSSSQFGGINLRAYTIAKFAEDETVLRKLNKAGTNRFIWTPKKVRALSTEEIIKKIESVGIFFNEPAFLAECKKHKVAWHVSDLWMKDVGQNVNAEMDDFLGLAACILWERLNAPHVSYEMLDDMMQEGYRINDEDEKSACDVWWKVWSIYKDLIIHRPMSIKEIDAKFNGTQSLFNWCQDFKMELLNAALKDREYAKLGITFCTEFLDYFSNEDDELLLHSFMSDMAEMYALSGDQDKGESLMREFIEKYPNLARGYVTLAWIIRYRKRNSGDESIEDQLKVLEQARDYPVVDGKDFSLKERIAYLKKTRKSQDGKFLTT